MYRSPMFERPVVILHWILIVSFHLQKEKYQTLVFQLNFKSRDLEMS